MTRKTGGKNTSHGVNVNHCTSSYRWGGKTQDEHKKPFKNTSPEKGRPVLNTVQNIGTFFHIALLENTTTNQIQQQGNTAAALENGRLTRKIKGKNVVVNAT